MHHVHFAFKERFESPLARKTPMEQVMSAIKLDEDIDVAAVRTKVASGRRANQLEPLNAELVTDGRNLRLYRY